MFLVYDMHSQVSYMHQSGGYRWNKEKTYVCKTRKRGETAICTKLSWLLFPAGFKNKAFLPFLISLFMYTIFILV